VDPGKNDPPLPPATDYTQANAALAQLLPDTTGYKWVYNGAVDYGHQMTLEKISAHSGETNYTISGSVEDLSGGGSKADFSLKLTYTIKDGQLIQDVTAPMIMDQEKGIVLIKAPLEKGTSWSDKITTKDGKTMDITGTITDIRGGKIFVVKYQDKDSDYYEVREIQQGVGVIKYTWLFKYEGGSSEMGYWLRDDLSGTAEQRTLLGFLPPLGTDLYYAGMAEYAHTARVSESNRGAGGETYYTADGTFQDGSGLGGTFQVSYLVDRAKGEVTEEVLSNSRTGNKELHSIMHNPIILKSPLQTGAAWTQEVTVTGKPATMKAEVTEVRTAGQNEPRPGTTIVKVRYTVDGVQGYYQNRYIEERTFQQGRGMIGFSNLMPGDLGGGTVADHMFGYGLSPEQ
jgi:hypothetical protein